MFRIAIIVGFLSSCAGVQSPDQPIEHASFYGIPGDSAVKSAANDAPTVKYRSVSNAVSQLVVEPQQSLYVPPVEATSSDTDSYEFEYTGCPSLLRGPVERMVIPGNAYGDEYGGELTSDLPTTSLRDDSYTSGDSDNTAEFSHPSKSFKSKETESSDPSPIRPRNLR